MSEFFMEQPETIERNAVQKDVHQRVPNNYRLWVVQLRKAGLASPKGARHLRHGDKSVKRIFSSSPRRKNSLLSRRGYISDPKSITSANKILVCKRETETIGFINLAIGNALGKW